MARYSGWGLCITVSDPKYCVQVAKSCGLFSSSLSWFIVKPHNYKGHSEWRTTYHKGHYQVALFPALNLIFQNIVYSTGCHYRLRVVGYSLQVVIHCETSKKTLRMKGQLLYKGAPQLALFPGSQSDFPPSHAFPVRVPANHHAVYMSPIHASTRTTLPL